MYDYCDYKAPLNHAVPVAYRDCIAKGFEFKLLSCDNRSHDFSASCNSPDSGSGGSGGDGGDSGSGGDGDGGCGHECYCGSVSHKADISSLLFDCQQKYAGQKIKFSSSCNEKNNKTIPHCNLDTAVTPPDKPDPDPIDPTAPLEPDPDPVDPNLAKLLTKLSAFKSSNHDDLLALMKSNKKAITDLTSSNAEGMNVLDNSIKAAAAENKDSLDKLRASNEKGDKAILSGLSDFSDSNAEGLKKINDTNELGFETLDDSLTDILAELGGINGEVDTKPTGVCYASPGSSKCSSFYTSNYPEGLNPILTGFMNSFKNDPSFDMVKRLTELDISNASPPDFRLCIDLGSMGDYGCHDVLNKYGVWVFLRFCFLISSFAAARQIVFGG